MWTSKVKGQVLALVACAASIAANAGGAATGGATEWTQVLNYSELTKVSADSAMSSVAAVQSHITQLEQFRVQLKNAVGIDPSVINAQINQVNAELNTWRYYQSKIQGLQGSLGQQQAAIDQRVTEARLTGGDFNSYVANRRSLVGKEAELEKARLEREQQILERTNDDARFVQDIGAQIKASESERRDFAIMNQQLSRLITQNSNIIEVLVRARQGGDGRLEQRMEEDHAAAEVQRARARRALFDQRWQGAGAIK